VLVRNSTDTVRLIYIGMRTADKVAVFFEVHRLAEERWVIFTQL
jgi:hypothetical protein